MDSFKRCRGAYSPLFQPEFANLVAITTFPALFRSNSFFSELKKASTSQKWSERHAKEILLDLLDESPGSPR